MDREKILEILKSYSVEISEMLPRFKKDASGLQILNQDGTRLHAIVLEVVNLITDYMPSAKNSEIMVVDYFNKGNTNYFGTSSYNSLEEIKGVIDSLAVRIERNTNLFSDGSNKIEIDMETKIYDGLNTIIRRFHSVAMQLRKRHNDRSTLKVNDEYDVQDLFSALLKLYFNDVRHEEWLPSYAGSSSRSDFLLPEIATIIEIKKTRQSMSDKVLGEQLLIDIANYKKHPQCKTLLCFVYDPEGRIANPRGLESDLSDCDADIDVRTHVVPLHE